MTKLVDKKEIENEFLEALHRLKSESQFKTKSINPVIIPLNSDGDILKISSNSVQEFSTGDSKLYFEYIIPRNNLDITDTNELVHEYAEEVYKNESLNLVHSVLENTFEKDKSNFLFSSCTSTTYSFKQTIHITNPQIAPTRESMEIIPVVTVDVNKKYIFKKKSEQLSNDTFKNVDIVFKAKESSTSELNSGDKVNLLDKELELKDVSSNLFNSIVQLDTNSGKTIGYINDINGDWKQLLNVI